MKGTIISLKKDRNFGFISYENSNSVYFHINSFPRGTRIEDLRVGDIIDFNIKVGSNMKPAAVNCKKVSSLFDYFLENATIAPSRAEGYDEFCDNVKTYAFLLKEAKVTTSMIRKIYSQILVAEEVIDLKMLRPQFAYTAGRNENDTLEEFMELLDNIVKNMDTNADVDELNNFKKFMEAIVAYRKYFGDRN